jgi:prepilin-type N-terminal cleavage/methylation domain-containing protein
MKRRGFSLVELMVVIGILAVLAGIILAATLRARGHAEKASIQANLATIATALAAYKQDFGDYPRIAATELAPGADPLMNELGNPGYLYGSEILCWSLIAPYGATAAGTFAPGDGADGPGWRERGTRGQVIGSYINIDTMKFGTKPPVQRYQTIFDSGGMPVLYVPRTTKEAHDPVLGARYVARSFDARWDFRYIDPAFSLDGNDSAARLARVQALLGDVNQDGYLHSTESGVNAPFILWSAGVDGQFATEDDVRQEQ